MNKKWTITGERIKIRLKALRMTQKELAEKTGYSEVTISRWASSSRVPRGTDYPVLAKALMCSCDYLLGLEVIDNIDAKILALHEKGYDNITYCLNNKGIETLYDVMINKKANLEDFANILMGLFISDDDLKYLNFDYNTLISISKCINDHPAWFNACKNFTKIDIDANDLKKGYIKYEK